MAVHGCVIQPGITVDPAADFIADFIIHGDDEVPTTSLRRRDILFAAGDCVIAGWARMSKFCSRIPSKFELFSSCSFASSSSSSSSTNGEYKE